MRIIKELKEDRKKYEEDKILMNTLDENKIKKEQKIN